MNSSDLIVPQTVENGILRTKKTKDFAIENHCVELINSPVARLNQRKENEMGKYYYGNPDNSGAWEQTASVFAGHDSVNSEKTSSLALVQFWKPRNWKPRKKLVAQLVLECGVTTDELLADDSSLCFEYPVSVNKDSGGEGKPSMTDLMIITKQHVIAIEAKWTECGNPYPLIGKWKQNGKCQNDDEGNREKVLKGWMKYIEDLGYSINREKIDEIAYQFLHRIASSCYVAKHEGCEPQVVYHLFYHNTKSHDDVMRFANKLKNQYEKLFDGEKRVPLCIIETAVEVFLPQGMEEIAKRNKKRLNDIFVWMQKNDVYRFENVKAIYVAQ